MVWLSIGGSNNDCEVDNSGLSELSNERRGCPSDHLLREQWRHVNCRAFQELAAILKSSGIEIKGILLDREFCTHDVFAMMAQSADTIR